MGQTKRKLLISNSRQVSIIILEKNCWSWFSRYKRFFCIKMTFWSRKWVVFELNVSIISIITMSSQASQIFIYGPNLSFTKWKNITYNFNVSKFLPANFVFARMLFVRFYRQFHWFFLWLPAKTAQFSAQIARSYIKRLDFWVDFATSEWGSLH